jgi:hypothetical protein
MNKDIIRSFQEILEHCMAETKEAERGLALIGLSYRNTLLTGFFVNPCDPIHVHIWKVRISPDGKTVYSDTWREVMLLPIDGYRFPRYVNRLVEEEALRRMGFSIPAKNEAFELTDFQWRVLWAVKENLKDYEEDAGRMAVDLNRPENETAVFAAYMRALYDLRDILGNY